MSTAKLFKDQLEQLEQQQFPQITYLTLNNNIEKKFRVSANQNFAQDVAQIRIRIIRIGKRLIIRKYENKCKQAKDQDEQVEDLKKQTDDEDDLTKEEDEVESVKLKKFKNIMTSLIKGSRSNNDKMSQDSFN